MAPILAETVEIFHPTIGVWASLIEQNLLHSLMNGETLGIKLALENMNEDELRYQLQSSSFQGRTILEPAAQPLLHPATSSMPRASGRRSRGDTNTEMALSNQLRSPGKQLAGRKRKQAAEDPIDGPTGSDAPDELLFAPPTGPFSGAGMTPNSPSSRFVGVVITSNKRAKLGS